MSQPRTQVSIVQRRLTHYRVPLFQRLRERLERHDIELRVHVGQTPNRERTKKDSGYLSWATDLPTTYLLSSRLCWQPLRHLAANSSLLILPQETSMIGNMPILLRRPDCRVAFWGHGANLQGNPDSLAERFKRWTTTRVDWWFAYTSLSVDLVARAGFPLNRITCLNNAIDTDALTREVDELSSTSRDRLRKTIGLPTGFTAVFVGSLYEEKRLPFLLAAAELIRKTVPDFSLIIIGAGPQEHVVRAATRRHSWIHYLGPQMAAEKAASLALADVVLNPGLVGLSILDGFAAGLPLITTDCRIHSPEIAYLTGATGIITDNNVDAFADACIQLAGNPAHLASLKAGCRNAAKEYTLNNMVTRFADGICHALETSLNRQQRSAHQLTDAAL